jgi:hypothetical protein
LKPSCLRNKLITSDWHCVARGETYWFAEGGFATLASQRAILAPAWALFATCNLPLDMTTAAATMPPSPIAGVAPAELKEVTVMTVWPSNARFGLGRWLGRQYAMQWPDIYIFRIGNLIALLSIPIALVLFFMRIAPFVGTRYRLTNRRIVVQRGLSGVEDKAVDLDRFATIDIVVQPGQAWYDAGDLVFKQGNVETFRLEGVSRPEAFRQTCLKARMAHAGVKLARQRQRA